MNAPIPSDPAIAAVLHCAGQMWEACRGILVAQTVYDDEVTDADRAYTAAIPPWEKLGVVQQATFGMLSGDPADSMMMMMQYVVEKGEDELRAAGGPPS